MTQKLGDARAPHSAPARKERRARSCERSARVARRRRRRAHRRVDRCRLRGRAERDAGASRRARRARGRRWRRHDRHRRALRRPRSRRRRDARGQGRERGSRASIRVQSTRFSSSAFARGSPTSAACPRELEVPRLAEPRVRVPPERRRDRRSVRRRLSVREPGRVAHPRHRAGRHALRPRVVRAFVPAIAFGFGRHDRRAGKSSGSPPCKTPGASASRRRAFLAADFSSARSRTPRTPPRETMRTPRASRSSAASRASPSRTRRRRRRARQSDASCVQAKSSSSNPDPHLRVRYLAIAGGVQAPTFLGSRSTLAACGLGREIRRGDRIASANAPVRDRAAPPRPNAARSTWCSAPTKVVKRFRR